MTSIDGFALLELVTLIALMPFKWGGLTEYTNLKYTLG